MRTNTADIYYAAFSLKKLTCISRFKVCYRTSVLFSYRNCSDILNICTNANKQNGDVITDTKKLYKVMHVRMDSSVHYI